MSEELAIDVTPEAAMRMAILDAEYWFSHYARIRLKNGRVEKVPKVNKLQERVFEHYRYCQARGLPCLIQILKPRQKGASTVSQGVIYHHMRKHGNLNGVIMGDVQATSDKVFEMFRRYAELDEFPWEDGLRLDKDSALADKITLPGGSTFSKETAGSSNAGRSGTVQIFHGDETAFWTQAQGKDPWNAVLNSFADDLPVSLAFVTSTANGASGSFYNTWKGENAWFKIFAAWYEFDDSEKAFPSAEARELFEQSMTDDEHQEREMYQVTLEQLNWRRHTIATKCEGDIGRFRQEFPSNDEECFMLTSNPRFDIPALRAMEAEAASQEKPERFNLVIQDGFQTVTAVPDARGDVEILEHPDEGRKYLVSVDTMTGEDQSTGGTTIKMDWHSPQVWRAGYTTQGGQWMRPKVVAKHRSQVDTDVLAEVVAGMSIYYGKCMTIPEVNGQGGLHTVKQLLLYRIPVFRRRAHSAAKRKNQTDEEQLGAYGWLTDALTKKWIVDHMVPLIRKGELEIWFPSILKEMRTFVRNAKGSSEALSGHFDDEVISACIAVYNLGSATEFKPEWMRNRRRAELPPGWRVAGQ